MRETSRKGLFWNWGQYMYQFRWVMVFFWIILFIFLGTYAPKLPELLKENGFTPSNSESDIGFQNMQEQLDFAPSMLNIVYKSDTMDLTDSQVIKTILDSLSNLRDFPYVKDIRINETSRIDQRKDTQSVLIELSLNEGEALEKFSEIRGKIKPPEDMSVYVDGGTATLYDVQQATKRDMAKSEMIGIPIALIVLLIIFGTVWAAILPLIVGVMSVTVTLGTTYFIAQYYSLSNFLPNIVMMLGLAIGIDYALFVVSRFREELKTQLNICEAVAMTSQKAGKSVFFSGLAVLIGMFGMLFIDLPIMYALCLGGVLVVLASVTISNTLLLALLSIFGHKINSLRVFPALQRKFGESTVWEKVAFTVMKRPIFLGLAITSFLLLLMFPISEMKLGVPSAEVLPPSYESRIGADVLKQVYDAREGNPIYILVKSPNSIWKESSIREIQSYSNEIQKISGVKDNNHFIKVLGNHNPHVTANLLKVEETKKRIEVQKLAKDNVALITVIPQSDPDSLETDKLVRNLRQLDHGSLKTLVTGESAFRVDMLDRIIHGLPALIAFVMTVTYLVLFFAFKSVLLPLKAVFMNILSLGASLGIVVLVFQKGWLAEALQITSTGYVSIIMPVTIFCVVFGISMDYEVFLISRIMEEYERTGDNDSSTATGLKKTGGLITSAASILMVVVGSFIFTDIEITKALGLGLFSAIFIDATFIRIIVVPALMKLLGNANWWSPAWLHEK